MTHEEIKAAIARLTTNEVLSVYSGKPGCWCGCKGSHRYNSKHKATAPSYAEFNDRQVAKVLNVLKANMSNAEHFGGLFGHGFSVTIGDRDYGVYITTDPEEAAK